MCLLYAIVLVVGETKKFFFLHVSNSKFNYSRTSLVQVL